MKSQELVALLTVGVLWTATADVVAPARGTWSPEKALNETLARVSFRYQPRDGADSNGVIRIALFDIHAIARLSKFYEISLRAGGRSSSLLRCPMLSSPREPPLWQRQRRTALAPAYDSAPPALPDARPRVCSVAMLFGPEAGEFPTWVPGRNYSVVVEVDKGLVRVWLDGRMWQWIDTDPFDIFWYRLSQFEMDGSFDREDALMAANVEEGNVDCVQSKTCKCKVGFEGVFCKTLCSPGLYGKDCASSCGQCLGASCDPLTGQCSGFTCDPFSGACPLGCQPGFLPPLCTQEVVRLREAPTLEVVNASAIRVSVYAKNVVGRGRARALLLQYQLANGVEEASWSSLPERPLADEDELVTSEVTGLRPGAAYRVRALLLAAEGDGVGGGEWSPFAPEALATTHCSVPDNFEYKIYAFVDWSELHVGWMAAGVGAGRCQVEFWRLKLWPAFNQSRWAGEEITVKDTMALLPAPPTHAMLSVQAITKLAELPPSNPVAVVSKTPEIGEVQDLDATPGTDGVRITWKPPSCCTDMPLSYEIEYACRRLVLCNQNCINRRHFIRQVGPEQPLSLVLTDLTPYAFYELSVLALLPQVRPGPQRSIVFQTQAAAPGVAPDPKDIHVEKLRSDGFRLRWGFPDDCAVLNGRIGNGHYSLRPALGGLEAPGGPWPREGEAGDTHPFTRLQPDTPYVATMYYVSNGKKNPNLNTSVVISTLPEGAEEVRVFMSARDRVGLRWRPPVDGAQLRELLVAARPVGPANAVPADDHNDVDSFVTFSELSALDFERCRPWNTMICATVTGLQPDTRYYIKVHTVYYVEGVRRQKTQIIQNTTSVMAVTREGPPSEPRGLQVKRSSASSLTLAWRAPRDSRGVLRNFIVIAHNMRLCCGPNVVSVIDTLPNAYEVQHEIKDLPPSSTFLVSVAAVTSVSGPAVNVTAHTAPAIDRSPLTLQLEQRPWPCLRLRLPPQAAADLPPGVNRRLFSFMVLEAGVLGRRVASQLPDSIRQGAEREAVLSALPPVFHALTEIVQEPDNGTVCATLPEGLGETWKRMRPTAGLLMLLEYEGVYSSIAWQNRWFTLLDCFSSGGTLPGLYDDTYSCF